MTREIVPMIVVDAQIRFGRPVIQGTQIPVEIIVSKVAGGMTIEEVAQEYAISVEDVRAALRYRDGS